MHDAVNAGGGGHSYGWVDLVFKGVVKSIQKQKNNYKMMKNYWVDAPIIFESAIFCDTFHSEDE